MIVETMIKEKERQNRLKAEAKQHLINTRVKVGKMIEKQVDKTDLSYADLARLVGTSPSAITKLIKGKLVCSIELYERIEKVLKGELE